MDKNEIILEEMFKKECKIIDLFFEYVGFDGAEKYAIITDLEDHSIKTNSLVYLVDIYYYIFIKL